MNEPEEILKIITIGRQFWHNAQDRGVWAAELLWVDDDGRPVFDQLKGEATGSDHVALEVHAALEGLKAAASIDRPVEIHSVNESVVKTIPEYAPNWKSRNWTKNNGEKPASLEEWQQIDEICQPGHVKWIKRPKEKIDNIKDWYELWNELVERENIYAMARAMARDTR